MRNKSFFMKEIEFAISAYRGAAAEAMADVLDACF